MKRIILMIMILIIMILICYVSNEQFNNSNDINSIKFAIVMATFNRKNGKTPSYLKRAIECIINQKHKNWDIILVGDKFEPEHIVIDIVNSYKNNLGDNKIIYLNNQIVERDYIFDKYNLWKCAGARSMNMGLKYARENNYKYYCHLDDDDYWSDTHLLELAKIYNNYPNCIFSNTQSTYTNSFLPKENFDLYENNRMPLAENTIHSSISFRIDILDSYYTTGENMNKPADAMILDEIKEFLENNKQYSSIYIPVLTCYHDIEGETMN